LSFDVDILQEKHAGNLITGIITCKIFKTGNDRIFNKAFHYTTNPVQHIMQTIKCMYAHIL